MQASTRANKRNTPTTNLFVGQHVWRACFPLHSLVRSLPHNLSPSRRTGYTAYLPKIFRRTECIFRLMDFSAMIFWNIQSVESPKGQLSVQSIRWNRFRRKVLSANSSATAELPFFADTVRPLLLFVFKWEVLQNSCTRAPFVFCLFAVYTACCFRTLYHQTVAAVEWVCALMNFGWQKKK